jgi:hypothetical protein
MTDEEFHREDLFENVAGTYNLSHKAMEDYQELRRVERETEFTEISEEVNAKPELVEK